MKKVLLALGLAASMWAAGYQVGESVSPVNVQDQFGKTLVMKSMPKTLIMAYEKETAATINEYLAAQDKEYLKQHNASFIADISGMPNFIAEAFALPKMRKYPHTIWLIRDEEQGLKFPAQDGKITIMKFDGNKVKSIDYISTPAELKAAVEQ